jgi:hypothetical protein
MTKRLLAAAVATGTLALAGCAHQHSPGADHFAVKEVGSCMR